MPRTCTICASPACAEINAALIAGEASFRNIAKQYGTSATALTRHKAEHLPAALARSHAAEQVAAADTLLGQVQQLQARTLKLLDTAENAGELHAAVAAIRAAKGNLELLAKLRGDLDERPQINLIVSAEWVSVRTTVLQALAPYPEARAAAAAALLAGGAAAEGGGGDHAVANAR